MAEALSEVQESLARNLALNKPGPAHGQLERLARYEKLQREYEARGVRSTLTWRG